LEILFNNSQRDSLLIKGVIRSTLYPLPCLCPYSLLYSQLPSVSGGRLLKPQPEHAQCDSDVTRGQYILMTEIKKNVHLIVISGSLEYCTQHSIV